MIESRTKKTIKNVQIALIYYFIDLSLKFISRKIFITRLGAEVLGLNTTAANLLGFLNIAELGIGAAISYSLYTPLYENDRQKISEIVSIQGWMYKRVASIVIAGSVILMCFFPVIFKKVDIPMWYTYATFSVLLFSSLLGYFVNYRQIVLTADQKDYKITINLKGFTVVKIILQILVVYYLSNGYIYWLILEIVAAVVSSYALDRLLKKEYPWLITSTKEGHALRKKYPEIILKTKQLFAHKLGKFALSQTSSLIIYAFTSLTLVAIYGNYMLMVTGLSVLANALFNSLTAGVGSLVAEGNKEKVINFFWSLTAFRMWLASVFCFSFYLLATPLVTIWIGQEYLLDNFPFILLTFYLFIDQTRFCDIFINAFGLYKDIWAPVIEAALNIGFSIGLGYLFGLSGIIAGVLISLIIVIAGWKPIFLFINAFETSPIYYFVQYLKYVAFIVISLLVCYIFNKLFLIKYLNNTIILLGIKIFIYIICSLSIFLFFEKRMKSILLKAIKSNRIFNA
jgi:O-antigen/teichoic acid export membrane protein